MMIRRIVLDAASSECLQGGMSTTKPFLCCSSMVVLIAVCIYRYVITFGLRSKYDVLGHYFIFMIVLPSINKFNMT